jgi:hypothetical protein
MRLCEFCDAKVNDVNNKCTGCGATQSTQPAPVAPVVVSSAPIAQATPAQSLQQAVGGTGEKPQGSWAGLGCLIIVFWPAAIFYWLSRKW